MHQRVTVLACVCLCVCVCVFVYHCVWVSVCYHSSGSIAYFYVKLRYQQLYYGILLILNNYVDFTKTALSKSCGTIYLP